VNVPEYEGDLKECGMSGTIRLLYRNKFIRHVLGFEVLARFFNPPRDDTKEVA